MSIKQAHSEMLTAKALGEATTELLICACELAEAGRFTAALEANAAARRANVRVQTVLDDIGRRWWFRLADWLASRKKLG